MPSRAPMDAVMVLLSKPYTKKMITRVINTVTPIPTQTGEYTRR